MKIALYKSTRPGLPGIFNRAVRWWCRGEYSHCEVVFSDGLSASSSFMDGGVRIKKINFDSKHWDFFDAPFDEKKSREWFELNKGKKFDIAGLFGFVIRAFRDNSNKYFCSESVMASFGYDEAWRFDPCIVGVMFKKL